MLMYTLIEYSDIYSRTSGILWQYCRDEPAVNNNGAIFDFVVFNFVNFVNFNTTSSFKIMEKQ